jgi:hypothetical protein
MDYLYGYLKMSLESGRTIYKKSICKLRELAVIPTIRAIFISEDGRILQNFSIGPAMVDIPELI